MVVAARAIHGQPQPHRGGRFHSIGHVFDDELVGDNAPFVVYPVIAIEGGRQSLIASRMRQQVSGKLLDGELIERHIGVIGVDDPVPPGPLAATHIILIAARIGVPSRI